ncbi:MAG: M23 family metallopeptidase [Bacteroidota bacterium]
MNHVMMYCLPAEFFAWRLRPPEKASAQAGCNNVIAYYCLTIVKLGNDIVKSINRLIVGCAVVRILTLLIKLQLITMAQTFSYASANAKFHFAILLLTILLAPNLHAQTSYPQDYFRAPVEGEVKLSGTFGELRSNHFHSGIDVKGFRGRKIVAVADGYVYRISVQAGGYGNALYMKHPNGYSSVYCHLNRFPKEIADYVKAYQMDNETFEVNLKPDSSLFVYKQGDFVGTMGNTGYSFGPHLHFEIRDSKTDEPINALLFGIQVKDTRPPVMNQVRVFGLDKRSISFTSETVAVNGQGAGKYRTKEDTLYVNADRAGVAIKSYDVMDGVRNWNGVYQIQMKVDGEEIYDFEADRFAFDEWYYVFAHVDYPDMIQNKSYFNRTYLMPGNQFSGYTTADNRGVLNLDSQKAKRVEILSKDIEGNTSRVSFWIKRENTTAALPDRNHQYYLPYQQANQINNYYLYLKFPEGSFYEDLEMEYHFERAEQPNLFSTIHSIHNDLTPLHKSFTIAIRPDLIPEHLREKAFIAKCDDENEIINCGGKWENGLIATRVRSFGDYAVMIDTVPPRIQAEDFRENLAGRKSINFLAKDNLQGGGRLKYQATIDGEWVLLKYDLKYDRFTHTFEEGFPKGKHLFKLEITDGRGNTAIFEEPFVY